jgi:RNA polymerase sigma-70 factor (ECF subfamily)
MTNAQFQNTLAMHKDRVFRYVFYFVKNREDAEDVTQDVFCRLWINRDSIQKDKTGTWLMRVAHNVSLDCVRKKDRKIASLDDPAYRKVQVPSVSGSEGNPEKHLERNENQSAVLSALDKLPDRTRCMLLLHYFEEMTYEEIGTIMDATVTAVKVNVHRGRKQMKSLMQNMSERG